MVYGIYQVITLPLVVLNNIINFKISFLNSILNLFTPGVNPLFGR